MEYRTRFEGDEKIIRIRRGENTSRAEEMALLRA